MSGLDLGKEPGRGHEHLFPVSCSMTLKHRHTVHSDEINICIIS